MDFLKTIFKGRVFDSVGWLGGRSCHGVRQVQSSIEVLLTVVRRVNIFGFIGGKGVLMTCSDFLFESLLGQPQLSFYRVCSLSSVLLGR